MSLFKDMPYRYPYRGVGGVLISLTEAFEPIGG